MQKTNLFLRKKVFINQTLLISFINFFFGKQTKVCFFLANRVGCRLCIRSYTLLHIIRSPRGSVSAFHSCSLCIYGVAFHTVWGFCLFSNISHATPPCITVSVRRLECLPPASLKFAVAHETLAFGLSLPTVKRLQNLHLIADTHAWHTKKEAILIAP
jgi:hypothetical protein